MRNSRVTVSAGGVLSDPLAGGSTSWALNGSPTIAYALLADTRYQNIESVLVETNGKATQIKLKFIAYIPDGLRITTSPLGSGITRET